MEYVDIYKILCRYYVDFWNIPYKLKKMKLRRLQPLFQPYFTWLHVAYRK